MAPPAHYLKTVSSRVLSGVATDRSPSRVLLRYFERPTDLAWWRSASAENSRSVFAAYERSIKRGRPRPAAHSAFVKEHPRVTVYSVYIADPDAAGHRGSRCRVLGGAFARQVATSRALLFDAPRRARAFFEALVADSLDLGRPDEMKLVFDGHSRIKKYLKDGRAVRIETIS